MPWRRTITVVLVCLALAAHGDEAPPARTKAMLLDPAAGQKFTDIGSDDKTMPVLTDSPPLGGKGLSVALAKGDTVGLRSVSPADWSSFSALHLSVHNPREEAAVLVLNLFHAQTKNYDTRTVRPLTFKPGVSEVVVPLAELANVNGTKADLAHVVKFYLADEARKAPTLVFGSIWIEGKGTGGAGKAKPPAVHGDPARVARIRAAVMPKITAAISFDTPEADAICAALEVFPPDNPWNLVVEDWPKHPLSDRIVQSIGAAKPLRCNADMNFVLVPPDQKRIDVKLVGYPAESDPGPYPLPENTPIEGWPKSYPKLSLAEVQRKEERGDRHAVVVDPAARRLYEFYQLRKTDQGWQASCAAIFDLNSNALRPDGWTSTDAAGLPIYPAIVRHDELSRGEIEHALRVTVVKTRRAYIAPATHFASRDSSEQLPRMGERLRLKKDVTLTGFSRDAQTLLRALKKYGMLVADNGIDWAVSLSPDPRIGDISEELRRIKGSDFEVVIAP